MIILWRHNNHLKVCWIVLIQIEWEVLCKLLCIVMGREDNRDRRVSRELLFSDSWLRYCLLLLLYRLIFLTYFFTFGYGSWQTILCNPYFSEERIEKEVSNATKSNTTEMMMVVLSKVNIYSFRYGL